MPCRILGNKTKYPTESELLVLGCAATAPASNHCNSQWSSGLSSGLTARDPARHKKENTGLIKVCEYVQESIICYF